MRFHHCLFVPALLLVVPMLIMADPGSKIERNEERPGHAENGSDGKGELDGAAVAVPVPTPLPLKSKDELYNTAYWDAYSILSENNSCSRFFRGPSIAVEVLNSLAGQLQTKRFTNSRLAVTMSGETTTVTNHLSGLSYRLFKKAAINTNGPFYRKQNFPTETSVPNVGSFQPNTREVRVSILLHELGHLIVGPNGNWLLPNDGDDPAQSAKNTNLIESMCRDQILELEKITASARRRLREKAVESATLNGSMGREEQSAAQNHLKGLPQR